MRDAINEKATKFLDDLTEDVGMFLCSEDLDDEKQSEDDIRTLVQCVPTALSCEDDYHRLPIHNAIENSGGASLIPMLIEEGIKHNVGGEGMRGGLLRKDPFSRGSLFQVLSCYPIGNSDLDVIKRLREMGFIEKEDIKEYNLVWLSCNESRRFNYFAD